MTRNKLILGHYNVSCKTTLSLLFREMRNFNSNSSVPMKKKITGKRAKTRALKYLIARVWADLKIIKNNSINVELLFKFSGVKEVISFYLRH